MAAIDKTNKAWVRTCQECGWQQFDKRPNPDIGMTIPYANRKCTRCGSMGLDYGKQYQLIEDDES